MKREVNQMIGNYSNAENTSVTAHFADDDIDMADVIGFFARNKMLILGVAMAVTLLGTLYTVLKVDVHTYGTAIQIGSVAQKKIVDPAILAANMQNLHIPFILDEHYRQNLAQGKRYEITAKLPKGADVIFLESNCIENDAASCITLVGKVGNVVIDELNGKISQAKNALNAIIVDADKRIASMETDLNFIKQRIKEFDQVLKSSAAGDVGTKSLVLTELSGQLQTLEQQKYTLEALVTSTTSDLKNIEDSRLIYPVTKSIRPVGISKFLSVFLSAMAGLFIAVAVALLAELTAGRQ